MCEMWLRTRMKPPRSGIFSPSIQSCRVVASSTGLMMATSMLNAHPLGCCSLRTFTYVPVVPLAPRPRRALRRVKATRCGRSGALPDTPPGPRRSPPARIDAMTSPQYAVLVPVKPPARGKSRLVGPSDDRRRDLAAAFALDTVSACLVAERVGAVLAVTDDASFSRRLAVLGCAAIPDGVSGDLNATLRQAAAEVHRRWPHLVPAAVCADVPALRPEDLDAALAGAAADVPSFVADAAGIGTTL